MGIITTAEPMLNIEQLRQETPGCAHVLHLNNAGAALMPKPVLNAITQHLELEAHIGGYEAARKVPDGIAKTYQSIATLIGAKPSEIALQQSATRAWQQVFYALPFKPGGRILTCVSEYASNYISYLQMAEKIGIKIDVIPNDDTGQISIDALQTMLDKSVQLIAITHIPTNGGLVNPAEAVGAIAQKYQIPYLLDACQSVGQMPIDVQKIGCDFLSATSRKYLRGPRGTGFLYVSPQYLEQLEPPMLDLHSAQLTGTPSKPTYTLRDDARRFETWESSYINNLGLGAAVEYALTLGLDAIWARILHLATQLRHRLNEIPGVTLQDLGSTQCGIVSFTVAGKIPAALCQVLEQQHINISWSAPEYTFMDMAARHLEQGVLRASVHYYNTEDELERFCQALERVRKN